ncbi:MAG: hypothetical protein EOP49_12495, partial [Sphingobacteriales bacterium]
MSVNSSNFLIIKPTNINSTCLPSVSTRKSETVRSGIFMLNILLLIFPFATRAQEKHPFSFRETAASTGLLPTIAGIYGHAAAWGDVDGDGWLDLYVGTFNKDGRRNMLFRNQKGKFKKDKESTVTVSARTTGVIFADLDNDGDLDL